MQKNDGYSQSVQRVTHWWYYLAHGSWIQLHISLRYVSNWERGQKVIGKETEKQERGRSREVSVF